VTLAGIYKLDGRADDAIKTYEKAIAIKADDATALLALARLLQDRGDLAPARQRYETRSRTRRSRSTKSRRFAR
jgi:Tfp pilus assembly protein PilF